MLIRWALRIAREPAALLACACALALVATSACPRAREAEPVRVVEQNGVRVAPLGQAEVPSGPRNAAAAGDWSLRSGDLSAVVARAGSRHAGQLLDLSHGPLSRDGLDSQEVILQAHGGLVPLSTTSVKPVSALPRPGVQVGQRTRSGELVLTTTLVPQADGSLALTTRVENRGKVRQRGVRVGDRLRLFGRAPFAPGLGFVEDERSAVVDWLARPGPGQSYALVGERVPLLVHFALGLRGPVEQRAWSGPVDLEPGAVFGHRRRLLVGSEGLSVLLASVNELRGFSTGQVEGQLSMRPEWASVVVEDERGRPQAIVEPDREGRFRAVVPVGNYRVVLRAPGGSDRRRVRVDERGVAQVRLVVPEPATLSYEVLDRAGGLLPARLLLRGVPPTADPMLGPLHLASGAGLATYTATGRGRLSLPAGRYSVLVVHGPEFGIAEQEVRVDAATGAVLRVELTRAVLHEGYVPCDFHVHAEPSGDSDVPLVDRVTSLLAEGIAFAVATDHNHITDYAPAVQALGAKERIATAPGVELTTLDWGHFNAFPVPAAAALPALDQAPEVFFPAARERFPGALIQVNHPRMEPKIGYFSVGGVDARTLGATRAGFSWDFDTLEVFNGFELGDAALVERNLGEWIRLLLAGRRVTAVGNSDSHQLGAQWVGYPRTYVRVQAPVPSPDLAQKIASALRAGQAVVSNGPFIELDVAGAGPGDLVQVAGNPARARVRVHAAPWVDVSRVELLVDGQVAATVPMKPPGGVLRADADVALDLEKDAFVMVVARGERPLPVLPGVSALPLAFTNPVLLDVDGDGAHVLASTQQITEARDE